MPREVVPARGRVRDERVAAVAALARAPVVVVVVVDAVVLLRRRRALERVRGHVRHDPLRVHRLQPRVELHERVVVSRVLELDIAQRVARQTPSRRGAVPIRGASLPTRTRGAALAVAVRVRVGRDPPQERVAHGVVDDAVERDDVRRRDAAPRGGDDDRGGGRRRRPARRRDINV
eukprot:30656-Pelagococcus_subviridis.AAC.3